MRPRPAPKFGHRAIIIMHVTKKGKMATSRFRADKPALTRNARTRASLTGDTTDMELFIAAKDGGWAHVRIKVDDYMKRSEIITNLLKESGAVRHTPPPKLAQFEATEAKFQMGPFMASAESFFIKVPEMDKLVAYLNNYGSFPVSSCIKDGQFENLSQDQIAKLNAFMLHTIHYDHDDYCTGPSTKVTISIDPLMGMSSRPLDAVIGVTEYLRGSWPERAAALAAALRHTIAADGAQTPRFDMRRSKLNRANGSRPTDIIWGFAIYVINNDTESTAILRGFDFTKLGLALGVHKPEEVALVSFETAIDRAFALQGSKPTADEKDEQDTRSVMLWDICSSWNDSTLRKSIIEAYTTILVTSEGAALTWESASNLARARVVQVKVATTKRTGMPYAKILFDSQHHAQRFAEQAATDALDLHLFGSNDEAPARVELSAPFSVRTQRAPNRRYESEDPRQGQEQEQGRGSAAKVASPPLSKRNTATPKRQEIPPPPPPQWV